ncbi:hypothetical protein [Pedobacter sp. UBA5917]|jgi:hypothetical protein|uniref:hypothetical protein n=1 Tax=Pedobacter sp. UBA5917 TaxID=1947061 RepID=UPI0025D1A6C8|nr:hypothetical protein [Pedobacter sp. UBA5917]
MKKASSKIKLLEENLGVKINVDSNLDKFSKVVPDKMMESAVILANSKFKL